MNLLKGKPKQTQCDNLCGYRQADIWLLGMGHTNLPKITRELWSHRWWMNIIFGKEDNEEDSTVEDSRATEQSETIEVPLDLNSSNVAAGDSNSAALFSGIKPCVDDNMLTMLYDKVKTVNPTRCHHDKNSLKVVKKPKEIPFGCPVRNSTTKAL